MPVSGLRQASGPGCGGQTVVTSPGPVWAVAHDLAGSSIAVGDACGHLFVGACQGGPLVTSGLGSRIFDVIFADDAVVVALEDGRVCIGTAPQRELGRHLAPVRALVKHPLQPVLVSGGENGQLLRWDLDGRRSLPLRYDTGSRAVTCARFSPGGTLLATGSGDATTTIWDESGGRVATLRGHAERVWSVAFRADGRQLATTSADGTVCLWDTSTWQLEALADLRAPEPRSIGYLAPAITCSEYLPDGSLLLGALDGEIRRWDRQGGPPRSVASHVEGVLCLTVDRRGRCVSGSFDGTVTRWSGTTMTTKPPSSIVPQALRTQAG